MFGVIIIATLIHKINLGADDIKTVGKTRGHIELLVVLACQADGVGLAERGGILPQVDTDVQNFPFHDVYQLGLGVLNLVMQSPENAGCRPGCIILYKRGIDASLLVPLLLVRFFEKTTFVRKDPGGDHQ